MQHMTEAKAALMMAAGCIRAVASAVYGGWDRAMSTLVIFMMIDYVMRLLLIAVSSKKRWKYPVKSSFGLSQAKCTALVRT